MLFRKFSLPRPITHRKLYFTILVSFILLVFLVVLSTSTIFSEMYAQSMYNQLSSEYSYSLDRFVDEFDNIFTQADHMNFTLRQNPDVNSFLMDLNHDYLTINRVDIFLKQTQYISDYLRSIILYTRSFDFPIISGNVDVGINQFIRKPLKRPDIKSRLNIVFSSNTPDGLEGIGTVESLSLVYPGLDGTGDIDDQAVVMNFDRELVEKKLLGKNQGVTLVADNSGRVVLNSYNYPVEKDIGKGPVFERILGSGELAGSFNEQLDGDKKIITFRKSLVTDFYIVNIRSYSDITGMIIQKKNEVIFIGLLILLFFGAAGYLISRGIYSPVEKVTQLISGSRFAGSDPKLGEIATISKVFTETLSHLEELESKNEDRGSRIREELLRSLLRTDPVPDSLQAELTEYKSRVEFDNLILIAVKIDDYTRLEPNDRFAYEKALCSTIPDFLRDGFTCETVNMFEGEIAILLNFLNKDENSFDTLLKALNDILAVSRDTLRISLTIGVGGAANDIRECPGAYRKAVDMVKHRFVLGAGSIYHQKYLEDHLVLSPVYPVEIEEKLVESIKLAKKDGFMESLQTMIELLSQYPYPEAVSAFFQIVTACIKTINQTTSQMNNRFYLSFDDITSIFASLQTLGQAREWLVNIFDEYLAMLEEINHLKDSKHYKMIEKMQGYIRQQYQDINMSVESLSEVAGYTPYYFSKLFRDITGLNVTDYIRSIRIGKAKELLSEEALKINEIPSMVGFTNITHFYSVFKKDVGLTPLVYREYAQKAKA